MLRQPMASDFLRVQENTGYAHTMLSNCCCMQLTHSIGPSAEFVQDDQTEVVWLYPCATHNVCMLTNINLCVLSL